MKLTPHEISTIVHPSDHETTDDINTYSAKLLELVYLLTSETNLDDEARISIEHNLLALTSYVPRPAQQWRFPPTISVSEKDEESEDEPEDIPIVAESPVPPLFPKRKGRKSKKQLEEEAEAAARYQAQAEAAAAAHAARVEEAERASRARKAAKQAAKQAAEEAEAAEDARVERMARNNYVYPNMAMSKVLIDNYAQLLQFLSLYFNLSLASHITRFMVEVVYLLQYWEVYHLLYLLPDFDYFLRLVGFDVTHTPLGPLVRPPENYLEVSMQCGLQFPFPYPFYGYSYHSFDLRAEQRKMAKVSVVPYANVSLREKREREEDIQKEEVFKKDKRSQKEVQKTPPKAPKEAQKASQREVEISSQKPSPKRISQTVSRETSQVPKETPSEDASQDAPLDSSPEGIHAGKRRRLEADAGQVPGGYVPGRYSRYEVGREAEYLGPTSRREGVIDAFRSNDINFGNHSDGREGVQEVQDGLNVQDAQNVPDVQNVQNVQPLHTSQSLAPSNTSTLVLNDKPSDVSSSDENSMDDTTSDEEDLRARTSAENTTTERPTSETVMALPELVIVDDKYRRNKTGVIHQCHLTDPVTAQECKKIFYGKNELLRHQEFVHATKKKIYKCIYCTENGAKVQSYPRHDSLARHIRRKHGVTGKENKLAVNYAKENVEIVDDPAAATHALSSNPLPHPQYLNLDFTVKPGYTGFLLFNTNKKASHEKSTDEVKPEPSRSKTIDELCKNLEPEQGKEDKESTQYVPFQPEEKGQTGQGSIQGSIQGSVQGSGQTLQNPNTTFGMQNAPNFYGAHPPSMREIHQPSNFGRQTPIGMGYREKEELGPETAYEKELFNKQLMSALPVRSLNVTDNLSGTPETATTAVSGMGRSPNLSSLQNPTSDAGSHPVVFQHSRFADRMRTPAPRYYEREPEKQDPPTLGIFQYSPKKEEKQ